MPEQYQYPGEELFLFENAVTWKKYFSSRIRPYVRGNILEVGAGIGETTGYLLNGDVQKCICLEPDERLFTILQQKICTGKLPDNCSALHGNLKDLPAESLFDTIIYIDVLEHISNDRQEIAEAVKLLKSGGTLIILSPAYPLLFTEFDKAIGHYRRYTRKTLLAAINFKTLVLKQLFHLDSFGAVLLYLNKYLIGKKYPSTNDVRIWQSFFVPISKLMDRILFYKFGKSIIGIWQKR